MICFCAKMIIRRMISRLVSFISFASFYFFLFYFHGKLCKRFMVEFTWLLMGTSDVGYEMFG
jgi:hypothetical protein